MFNILFVVMLFTMISFFLLLLSSVIINYISKLKCLISFRKNCHRLLPWYTDLLSSSSSQTVVVHRLGAPRTVVTANPANVEYVLKTNFHNFPKGKPFTDILGDLLGLGIFNVDGELWSSQRKLASHEFTTRSLREFVVTAIEQETKEKLLPLLEEACEKRAVLDLQEVLRRFAFDVICKVSLGIDSRRFDLSRLVSAFDRAAAISAKRGTAPVFLVWKVKRALGFGSEKILKEEIELIHSSVVEIIKNKRKALDDHEDRDHDRDKVRSSCGGDLLTRLLLAGHGEEIVRDMVISFIMAGRDTTSAAMTWLFWLLSENPGVENDVVEEVKNIMNSSSSSSDYNNSVNELNYEALQGMSFLKACMCEAMRLYPPVPWDSKHAANDDVLPDGTVVRRGDRVTYFPYGMGRMEEVWGKDCLEFKPDRWFGEPGRGDDGGGRVLKPVSPFKFPVFQAGPRVCLGKEMAFTQMKYVVASVLSQFEIRPVTSDRPVFVPLLTAYMAGGLKVLVRRRCG